MQLFLEKVMEKQHFLIFHPFQLLKERKNTAVEVYFFATVGINCFLKILDLTFESKLDL